MGAQHGTATWEVYLVVPAVANYTHSPCPSQLTNPQEEAGHGPTQRTVQACHCSFTYNRQKLETTQMSVNGEWVSSMGV